MLRTSRAQSIVEYFLLLAVVTLVIVAATVNKKNNFFAKIKDKLSIYRDQQAERITDTPGTSLKP